MVVHTGQRGWPKKEIDHDFLKEAFSASRQIKFMELVDMLGIHRNTLWLYMRHHGIEWQYSLLSNADLDLLIGHFKKK